MSFYIGNQKIASLSQTINQDSVGNGLEVQENGKLNVLPGEIAREFTKYLNGEWDGEGVNPMDQFVEAIYGRIQEMQTGSTNMIDTESNPMFYRGLTRIDQFLTTSLTEIYSDYIGTTNVQFSGDENSATVLSVCFPKNMRIFFRSEKNIDVLFDLSKIDLMNQGSFSTLPYPSV